MSASTESYLSHARYGKDKVRVFRVVREGSFHHVVEYNVCALLEGEIDVSYTKADNSVVVATDSIKNITYYLAKTSPHILYPERFAIHLGTHLVSKYAHIHKAFVTIEKLRWARIPVKTGVAGQEETKLHPHSFYRDGDDKRVTSVEIDATGGKDKITAKVTSGISDLLVLKSTGSAFEGFVRDEYTTLVEVNDRIFSTSIDLSYVYKPFAVPAPSDEKKLVVDLTGKHAEAGTPWDGEKVAHSARKITLETFAVDESASVQATLYKMAQQIVAENPYVESVTYKLPNKHYVPVDMRYIGIDNLTPLSTVLWVLLNCVAVRTGWDQRGQLWRRFLFAFGENAPARDSVKHCAPGICRCARASTRNAQLGRAAKSMIPTGARTMCNGEKMFRDGGLGNAPFCAWAWPGGAADEKLRDV